MIAGCLPSRPRVTSHRRGLGRIPAPAPSRRWLEPWFRPLALVFRQPPARRTPMVFRAGDEITVTVSPRFDLTFQLFEQLRLLVDRSTPIVASSGHSGPEIPIGAAPTAVRAGWLHRTSAVIRHLLERPPRWRPEDRRRAGGEPPPAESRSMPIERVVRWTRRETDHGGSDDASVAAGKPLRAPLRARRPRPVNRWLSAGRRTTGEGRIALLRWPAEDSSRAGLVPVARRLTLSHQLIEHVGRAGVTTLLRSTAFRRQLAEGGGGVPIRSAERAPGTRTLHYWQPVEGRQPGSDVPLPAATFRPGVPWWGPRGARARTATRGGPGGAGLGSGSGATGQLSSDAELGDDRSAGWPEPRWRVGAGQTVDPGARVAGLAPARFAAAPTGPLPVSRALYPTGVRHQAMPDADRWSASGLDQSDGPTPGRLARGKVLLGRSMRQRLLSVAEDRRLGRVPALAGTPAIRADVRRPVGDVDLVTRSDRHTGASLTRPTAPVDQVFQRSVDPGSTQPEAPTQPPPRAAQPIDIDRLDRDLWERFEKRIQVERQRRGRA